MKRILWILCGFGFLGMWKLNTKLDPERSGFYVCELDIPLGLTKKKVVNLFSRIQPYVMDEWDGMRINSNIFLPFGGDILDTFTDPISLVNDMVSKTTNGIYFFTDGSSVPVLSKLCRKYGIDMNSHNITDNLMERFERMRQEKAHKAAVQMAVSDAMSNNVECPECDEVGMIETNGRCGNCGWHIVRDSYNIPNMTQQIMAGKKNIKPIKAA